MALRKLPLLFLDLVVGRGEGVVPVGLEICRELSELLRELGERHGGVRVGLVEAGVKGVGLGDDALEPVVDPLGLPRVEVHLPGQGADLVPEGLELLGVGVRLADDRVGRVEPGFQEGLLLPGRAGEASDLGPQRGHLQALLGSRRHHLVKPGQPPGEDQAGLEVFHGEFRSLFSGCCRLRRGPGAWRLIVAHRAVIVSPTTSRLSRSTVQ